MKKFDNIYVKKFGCFNLYVIRGNDGDILIDTGFILMKNSIKRWLDKFNIKLIILTHAHVDHIWNVSYIKDLYNCEVAIGKFDVDNIDNSKICSIPSSKKYKHWTYLMNWGMKKFIPDFFNIDYKLEDNQIINKYGIKLKIVHLPGHTTGSIGIMYNNYLFCGDSLVNRKINRVQIAYQNQDNIAACESVRKIVELHPKLIFAGHNRLIKYNKLLSSFD